MLLQPTADQQSLRETTEKFLKTYAGVDVVRGLQGDPAGFEASYWQRGCELGWAALLVSVEHGGGSVSELGLVDLSLVAYEFGVAAAPGPLVECNVVAGSLSAANSHLDVLEGILGGELIATWAVQEPAPHHNLGDFGLEVRVDGDSLVLNGTKRPVCAAAQASHLLVVGSTNGQPTQVLVPTDTPGLTITPLTSVDLTRRVATVTFTDVRVPLDSTVGEIGGAAAAVETQLQQAIVIACAESVGAMESAFQMTVEWGADRYSFGRPLTSYQALKHKYADMKSWLDAGHAIADDAAAAVASGADNADELVSAAKAFIGEYGSELMQECVQLHGGIGVTSELDLHLYLRRHTLHRSLFGTPSEHRRRLTDLVVAKEPQS